MFGVHRDKLQTKIRSCGIGFEIWEKTNADGKGSATFDLTSLLGNDKKTSYRTYFQIPCITQPQKQLQ